MFFFNVKGLSPLSFPSSEKTCCFSCVSPLMFITVVSTSHEEHAGNNNISLFTHQCQAKQHQDKQFEG